jgi:hypothetical protein
LGRDDTTLTESAVQELKVRLLEKSLGRALWVARVGDDNIKLVLLVLEEFKAVADNGLSLGVILTTSRRTPPSPPPITRTFLGLGWEFIARWVIISW